MSDIDSIHTCGPHCQQPMCVLRRERNEAYEAFQELWQFADEFLPEIPEEMAERWNKFFTLP